MIGEGQHDEVSHGGVPADFGLEDAVTNDAIEVLRVADQFSLANRRGFSNRKRDAHEKIIGRSINELLLAR